MSGLGGSVSQAISRVSLAAISAVLLASSFPDINASILVWIALVPLFFALDGLKPSKAFLVAYLSGSVFFLGTIYWLIHVTLPGMIVVVSYLALYFGLFGSVFSKLDIRRSQAGIFLAAAAWVACEWLRSNLLTGFGWALLGHSQAPNTVIIQIADIAGAYGVSFLVVSVNAAIFLTLDAVRRKEYRVHYLVVVLTLVFIVDAYGILRLKSVFTGERISVAVVQGNIPQSEKWNDHFRDGIIDKYEKLTIAVAKRKPSLVVWPETSVPVFIEQDSAMSGRIGELAKEIQAPVLVGAPSEDPATGNLYNSAVLFGRSGKIEGRYDKLHLVPFGEYVPFKTVLSFVERFAPSPIGDFSRGTDFTVFSFFLERRSADAAASYKLFKKVKFSCLICFEDIFPDLAREFVKRGAQFLVNMTNDAWFMRSSAPYQHVQSSIFRAVENRVNVVRAANTGVSCIIDQKGEIRTIVGADGKNIFVDGIAIADIVLARTKTIYTAYGDVFVFGCIFLLGVYFAAAYFKRNIQT